MYLQSRMCKMCSIYYNGRATGRTCTLLVSGPLNMQWSLETTSKTIASRKHREFNTLDFSQAYIKTRCYMKKSKIWTGGQIWLNHLLSTATKTIQQKEFKKNTRFIMKRFKFLFSYSIIYLTNKTNKQVQPQLHFKPRCF